MDDDYEDLDIASEGPEDLDDIPETSTGESDEISDIFDDFEAIESIGSEDSIQISDTNGIDVSTDSLEDLLPIDSEEEIYLVSDDVPLDIVEDVSDFESYDVSEDIVDLDALDSIPEEREYDDFELTVMDEAPDFYTTGEFYTQGINEYGFTGTCGPTSQANALNELFDTNVFTENNILEIAVDNDLCNIGEIPENSGGTTTGQFMELYDKVNETLDEKIQTELYEYDEALDVDDVAEKIEDGGVVNVAVDSSALWDIPHDSVDPLGVPCDDIYSDHWITVTDVYRDDEGNVKGFDIIDSGGGESYVDADKYHEICFGTDEHKVLDPTTIVITKEDDENIGE